MTAFSLTKRSDDVLAQTWMAYRSRHPITLLKGFSGPGLE